MSAGIMKSMEASTTGTVSTPEMMSRRFQVSASARCSAPPDTCAQRARGANDDDDGNSDDDDDQLPPRQRLRAVQRAAGHLRAQQQPAAHGVDQGDEDDEGTWARQQAAAHGAASTQATLPPAPHRTDGQTNTTRADDWHACPTTSTPPPPNPSFQSPASEPASSTDNSRLVTHPYW